MLARAEVKDALAGGVLALLGAVVLALSLTQFPPAPSVAADPSILPKIVAVGLLTSGLGLVAGSLWRRSGRSGRSAAIIPPSIAADLARLEEDLDEGIEPSITAAWAAVAAVAIYAYAAFTIGYTVATWAFITVVAMVMATDRTPRKLAVATAYAAVLSVLLYVIFIHLLNVRMPVTWLP